MADFVFVNMQTNSWTCLFVCLQLSVNGRMRIASSTRTVVVRAVLNYTRAPIHVVPSLLCITRVSSCISAKKDLRVVACTVVVLLTGAFVLKRTIVVIKVTCVVKWMDLLTTAVCLVLLTSLQFRR